LFSRFRTGADNKVKVTGVRSSARNTATSAAVRTTVESFFEATDVALGFAFWAQIDGKPKKPTAHAVEAKETRKLNFFFTTGQFCWWNKRRTVVPGDFLGGITRPGSRV
jgi:hypothetical protein